MSEEHPLHDANAEERAAWDRYATAYGGNDWPEERRAAARFADRMLAERRKRFAMQLPAAADASKPGTRTPRQEVVAMCNSVWREIAGHGGVTDICVTAQAFAALGGRQSDNGRLEIATMAGPVTVHLNGQVR